MNPRQFALLEHTNHEGVHWDLLLEVPDEDPLATWRVLQDPLQHDRCDVIPLPPHRRIYLEYEGPISGDRGSVRRIDRGHATVATDFCPASGGVVHFEGQVWRGSYRISTSHLTRVEAGAYDGDPLS